MERWIAIDVETTGLSPTRHEIRELAIVPFGIDQDKTEHLLRFTPADFHPAPRPATRLRLVKLLRTIGDDAVLEQRGRNAARTCRHFDISRQTFYRWWRRFERDGPLGLEGRSLRPRRLRRPTWEPAWSRRYSRCAASTRAGARTSWW